MAALGLDLSGAPLWGSACPGLRSGAQLVWGSEKLKCRSGARKLGLFFSPYPERFRRRLAEQSGDFQRVGSESPNKPLVNIYRSDAGSEIRVIN